MEPSNNKPRRFQEMTPLNGNQRMTPEQACAYIHKASGYIIEKMGEIGHRRQAMKSLHIEVLLSMMAPPNAIRNNLIGQKLRDLKNMESAIAREQSKIARINESMVTVWKNRKTAP